MSIDDERFELLSVLLKRRGTVRRLDEGPAAKRTLVEALDCSRSTVDRAVRELESHGLVAYEDGRYELTPVGEQAVAGTTELLDRIGVARELRPFLEHLPPGRFDLDLELLADADVLLPEPGNPWAMINRHVGVLERAEDVRAVLPLLGLHAQQVVHERVVEAGARAELVGSPEVVRTLVADPDFVERTREMAETGRCRVFQADERPPYFVGVMDEIVQIGTDEDGEPRAIVESTAPAVRDWAETTYDRFRGRATRVDLLEATADAEGSTAD
jgi:predicted transcriptional regulator